MTRKQLLTHIKNTFFLTDSDLVGEKWKILLCSIFSHVRHRKSAEITSVYWLLNSTLFGVNAAYVYVGMWLWSSQSLSCLFFFIFIFFKSCFDFLAFFFPLSPRGGRGDNVCELTVCFLCFSPIRQRHWTRQEAAVRCNQWVCLLWCQAKCEQAFPSAWLFSFFKKNKTLPFMTCFAILPWNIPVRHTLDHLF